MDVRRAPGETHLDCTGPQVEPGICGGGLAYCVSCGSDQVALQPLVSLLPHESSRLYKCVHTPLRFSRRECD